MIQIYERRKSIVELSHLYGMLVSAVLQDTDAALEDATYSVLQHYFTQAKTSQ